MEPSYSGRSGSNQMYLGVTGMIWKMYNGNFNIANGSASCSYLDGGLLFGGSVSGISRIFCNGTYGLMVKAFYTPTGANDGYALNGLGLYAVAALPSAAPFSDGNWAIITDCTAACTPYATPVGGGTLRRKAIVLGNVWFVN